MDEQRQDNQLEPIYNSSVLILDVAFEDLPGAMVDRDGWWERVREIHAGSATWWCTLWLLFLLASHSGNSCGISAVFGLPKDRWILLLKSMNLHSLSKVTYVTFNIAGNGIGNPCLRLFAFHFVLMGKAWILLFSTHPNYG